MKKINIASFPIYRWRYAISYTFLGLILVLLLLLASIHMPGGLTQNETSSALMSSKLTPETLTPENVIDLPYNVLQKASLVALGVSQISIKLPSLLLGLITALALVALLHRWFRPNVAVLTAIVVISTGQFLFIAQNGTSAILYLLWPSLMLLFATLIIQKAKWQATWYLLLVITIALSLYSPLSIYIMIGLLVAGIAHPKLRLALRNLPYGSIALPVLLGLAILLPLLTQVYQNPTIGLTLLGIPQQLPDLWHNATIFFRQYFDVISPSGGRVMTPFFGLGVLALIALGFIQMFRSRYTIRSYTIITWLILLLPVIILHPIYSSVIFVPLMLVVAIGIDTLIREWYKLFPQNPYARFAGLIPLIILISTLTATGIERYLYGYYYDPRTASHFSRDVRLLHTTVNEIPGEIRIVTSASEKEFYELMTTNPRTFTKNDVNVTTIEPVTVDKPTIYTRAAYKALNPDGEASDIAVNARSSESDRFYVYKNDEK